MERCKYYSKAARDNQKPDFSTSHNRKKLDHEIGPSSVVGNFLERTQYFIFIDCHGTAFLLMYHNGYCRPRFCCYCGCGHQIDCTEFIAGISGGGEIQAIRPVLLFSSLLRAEPMLLCKGIKLVEFCQAVQFSKAIQ